MADTSALAPGVALTSAVIYWAHMQSRLDTMALRVRTLNAELRTNPQASPRTASVQRQIVMLTTRVRVLHIGAVLSVIALVGFLGSSAALFVASERGASGEMFATSLFMLGLAAFGVSLLTTLWEMLWARRSLDEDVRSSGGPGTS